MAETNEAQMEKLMAKVPDNVREILDTLNSFWPNAQHHEEWVMDQVVRLLLGEALYQEFVDAYEAPRGDKGEKFMEEWPTGAPA